MEENAKKLLVKKTETKIPKDMKKLLMDIDITFIDWCNVRNIQRETARNVAAGVIQGKRGKSAEIKMMLEADFPEIFAKSSLCGKKEQNSRYLRIKSEVKAYRSERPSLSSRRKQALSVG